jgi:hypothetical protein
MIWDTSTFPLSKVFHMDPKVHSPSDEGDDRGELDEKSHGDAALGPEIFTCTPCQSALAQDEDMQDCRGLTRGCSPNAKEEKAVEDKEPLEDRQLVQGSLDDGRQEETKARKVRGRI